MEQGFSYRRVELSKPRAPSRAPMAELACSNMEEKHSFTDDEARTRNFSELKTYCVELLSLMQNSKKNSPALSQLRQFISRCSSDDLQPFFELKVWVYSGHLCVSFVVHYCSYALLPLLLLFDAAVISRSPPKGEESELHDLSKKQHKVHDAVAEGVVHCLAELLGKCSLASVDQMIVILKKLTSGLMLSPAEASEEFREEVIRCFKALLLSLRQCSDRSCSCRGTNGLPSLLMRKDLPCKLVEFPQNDLGADKCLVAFLHSQNASAAVGHWLSLLLKAADIEASRGHRGAASIRVEAFMTLRILTAKVGYSDALAFFLPGVVSQFTKVLYVAKTMSSGAAGSAEAVDQAVRGLTEFLMIVLEDDANLSALDNPGKGGNKDGSILSYLGEMRQLSLRNQDVGVTVLEDSTNLQENNITKFNLKGSVDLSNLSGHFQASRTKEWVAKTSANVNKLLTATFPRLCIHPSKKVKQGLAVAIGGLLSKCNYTLKDSRMMLLECLFVLACDDFEEVASAAQAFLAYLFSSSSKHDIHSDFAETFSRIIERLPKVVLGNDELAALAEVRKLMTLIYFAGPQRVANLLQSPVTTARFLDVVSLCLSHSSAFAGSLDRVVMTRPSTTGYLHSITEMTGSIRQVVVDVTPEDTKFQAAQMKGIRYPFKNSMQEEYELPHIPPWFYNVGSDRLYQALAGILRLVGVSLIADSPHVSEITDIPLGILQKLVNEVRMKEHSWQSWYKRTGSGHLVHRASTAVCILNEIIFGISDKAVDGFSEMFQRPWEEMQEWHNNAPYCKSEYLNHCASNWKVSDHKGARNRLVDSIGKILHVYLSVELWSLPLGHESSLQQPDSEDGDVSLHLFDDAAMLCQVVIEGIGIFSMCLGKDFSTCGFLHSSLYVLLENLICSNFHIRRASDAALHAISTSLDYPTVGHLVLANSDYVIDSICRQLRNLDLNPHVPNVLAAMLSFLGIAHKILPLLEEPMLTVTQELEVLGRSQHPNLTIPFLKAVAEIVKASEREALLLPPLAGHFCEVVKHKMSCVTKSYDDDITSSCEPDDRSTSIEEWESILFKLNDSRRYRRIVGSVSGSCLTAVTPLLASLDQEVSLLALNIVENGISALASVEEAYRHEKETKEACETAFECCSFYNLKDTLDTSEDVNDENRLLPAMNKIWPFLVSCFRNRNPLAVRRCSSVVSNAVKICGGDFFVRRFRTDGPEFWKLLTTSPFHKKLKSKDESAPLQLPYRRSILSSNDNMAEGSTIKVQSAILNMIADLARDKRSASALEAVLKKISGIVVGIAYSGVTGLREPAINALVGLSSIDSDLIWLLLSDVYYSKKKELPSPPPNHDFPDVSRILPPPSSPTEYLYVQYGGQSYGFDIDISSVETVFKKLHALVFTSQVYL
ncbi:uncharacterized protein LOC124939537 [Impatiens glandulifera]|uniref:uncharacterized protein LOC124939537 n=1 Tax=Impatiens glandulifera TaxID=253017 RepID=UPI001FB196DD|nr:uncharacterized protein LOC124939537 [Impatiens glandulifera]